MCLVCFRPSSGAHTRLAAGEMRMHMSTHSRRGIRSFGVRATARLVALRCASEALDGGDDEVDAVLPHLLRHVAVLPSAAHGHRGCGKAGCGAAGVRARALISGYCICFRSISSEEASASVMVADLSAGRAGAHENDRLGAGGGLLERCAGTRAVHAHPALATTPGQTLRAIFSERQSYAILLSRSLIS